VTIFAPTNRAFERLPVKLKKFLFSPLGEGVLGKLLQYHVVPGAVIHSSDSISPPSIYVFDAESCRLYFWKACKGNSCTGTTKIWAIPVRNVFMSNCTCSRIQRYEYSHSVQQGVRRNHPVASHNLTLPTLLVNNTIHAYIVQNKISFPFPGPKKPSMIDTRIFANRHLVVVPDIVGSNGAIHVIDKLLDPRKACHCPGHYWHRHRPGSEHHPQGGPFEDGQLPENWEDWENWLPQWAAQV